MIYILFIISILLFSAGIGGWLAAPYVPTRGRDIPRFLELAEIKKGDIVYDLGCGDGKILVAAASQGADARGFEISILNYLFCKIFRPQIKVNFKNFFKADFREADIVYMFLSPKAHKKMGEILRGQMKKGSKIIAYAWPIEGWEPEKINHAANRPDLYLYKI
ncbi:MAG: methionine biosynthesis protein MetW [bacterium]